MADEMPTRQKVLIGVLALLVIFWVYNFFLAGNGSPPVTRRAPRVPPRLPATSAPISDVTEGGDRISYASLGLETTYSGSWAGDPFYRPDLIESIEADEDAFISQDVEEKEPTEERLSLTGISRDEETGEAYVVINGAVMKTGNCIGELCIRHIGSDSVRLTGGGRSVTLTLGQE